jgi:multisubunit Na+/H+ antiporter MnhB subunit
MAKGTSKRGLIGAVASILIGAAVITFVVNILLDTLKSSSTSDYTNNTIAAIRPIVNAAIILVAVLAIVVVAGQMMGALGGI